MNLCPKCQQLFSSDTLYCLSDGTPLVSNDQIPEMETVVRPASPPQYSVPVTSVSRMWIAYLAGALLLLILAIGAAIGLFISFRSNTDRVGSSKNNSINTADNSTNTNTDVSNQKIANLQEQQDLLAKENKKLADELNKAKTQSNKVASTPVSGKDPSPLRISFTPGNAQETIGGSVVNQRTYILRAKAGQYLSANITSKIGCAVFIGNSTSLGYVTINGDNRITVVNNCDEPVDFTFFVSIR